MRYSLVRRTAVALLAAGTLAAFAACSDSTSPARGTIAVQLTDAPFSIDSLSSVDIFVVRVDARMADADSATAAQAASSDSARVNGWTTLASPNASINLLAYQNGTTLGLGQADVAAGSYQGFRLVIDPSKSSITLKTGLVLTGTSAPNVAFPSGSTSGLKIALSSPIVVAADDTTTMVVDFDVANSFVLRGNSLSQNGLLFKPVIRASVK
ncbi:MAG: DUF4382 domain-containing protein [Gemmatimonadaceae bacterium]